VVGFDPEVGQATAGRDFLGGEGFDEFGLGMDVHGGDEGDVASGESVVPSGLDLFAFDSGVVDLVGALA